MWEIRLKKAIRAVNTQTFKSLQPFRIKELLRTLRGIGLHNNHQVLKKAGISLSSLLINVRHKNEGNRKTINTRSPLDSIEEVQIISRDHKSLTPETLSREPRFSSNSINEVTGGLEEKAIMARGKSIQGWEKAKEEKREKRVSKSRVLERLYSVLTELRKKEEIDDTLRQKVIQNVQRQIKLNTWVGNRHKKSLPLKGRTINKYNSRRKWRP